MNLGLMPFEKRESCYLRVDCNKARGVRGMTHRPGPIEIPPARSDRRPEMVPPLKREREQTGKKRRNPGGAEDGKCVGFSVNQPAIRSSMILQEHQ
jgi:hypothetical protein